MAEDKRMLTQRIMREVALLYTQPTEVRRDITKGVLEMAKESRLKQKILAPRRRVTVLIIGNHSASKSSFINYYAEEYVQPVSVAVETRGFTIVRSGREQQELSGEGALLHNEHIKSVADSLGDDRAAFVDNLNLQVRKSTAKDMLNVDLIDTPGLCDGGIKYPFDVVRAIVATADVADLIAVFLDPMGQALVSLTMKAVAELNKEHHHKMLYFLTKADTVARHDDLMKCVAQTTQGLAPKLHDNHGFALHAFWIPERDRLQLERRGYLAPDAEDEHEDGSEGGASDRGAGALSLRGSSGPSFLQGENGLKKLLMSIRRTIDTKVQSNMSACVRDCETIMSQIEKEQASERELAKRASRWSCYTWAMVPLFLLLGLFSYLDILVAIQGRLPPSVLQAGFVAALLDAANPIMEVIAPLLALFGLASLQQRLLAVGACFLLLSAFSQFFKCRSRGLKMRNAHGLDALKESNRSAEMIRKHVQTLYKAYVESVQLPEYDPAAAGVAGAFASPAGGKAAGAMVQRRK